MIEFYKTADATARAKKLCRDNGLDFVWAAYSRFLPDMLQFRTRVTARLQATDADMARIVSVLTEAGYEGVAIEAEGSGNIVAYSALIGTVSTTAGELARRALVELLPESWSADEVSAMSDDEAIATAVGAGVLEG